MNTTSTRVRETEDERLKRERCITSYRVGQIPLDVLHPDKKSSGDAHGVLIVYGGDMAPNIRFQIRELGYLLAAERYRCFCFDPRSNLLGNNFRNFGIFDRIQDTAAVMEHLATDPQYAKYPLSIVAFSMGAPIAIAAAAKNKQRIRNLVLVAPAAYDARASINGIKFGSAAFKQILRTPRNWRRSDTFGLAKRLDVRRVALISFSADKVIPEEVLRLYRRHLKPADVVIPGFDHHPGTFKDPKKREAVLAAILDIFRTKS